MRSLQQKVFNIFWLLLPALVSNSTLWAQKTGAIYYPDPGQRWETRQPTDLGLNATKIQEAVQFAEANDNPVPRNLEIAHYQSFGREPFGDGLGPFKERGAPAGLIVYKGYIVAQWGDPQRVDMTFSVTKSLLSTTVGIAFDQGLIQNINEPVHLSMAPIVTMEPTSGLHRAARIGEPQTMDLFATEHNRKITWDHLLRQTSNWEGTLWGKPDWADRPDRDPSKWLNRELKEPGSEYEYNDVRVNVLALAALNVWRKPLPQVLKEYIMDPIGASPTWRWLGYDNSWVIIDGVPMQAVGGGGHWGGGMFINAYDMARFGYLTLRQGKWKEQQLLSEKWVQMARTPTPANTSYGFMNWFLNTDKKELPSAPETSFFHLGNGTNMVYVDPDNELVIVARWIKREAMDGLVQRALAAR
ncbi:MAG TPA: serine hydrolase [Saprospiraceae bacterium]|nr:serine hydrolase [Saprospiraceae bacterium]HMP25157.1 serine hydrolase [Saprospiraceae bacterium]